MIFLVKYVGFSTLLCDFNVFYVPEYVICDADKVIWNFIWDVKPDKVKLNVCRKQKIGKA